MNFSFKDYFSKYDQIRSKLRIWSHLLKKSLMKNLIFLCSLNSVISISTESTMSEELAAGAIAIILGKTLKFGYVEEQSLGL